MHNKDRKYIYYEDLFGAVLCYVDETQPKSEDTVFLIIIAERYDKDVQPSNEWNTDRRGQSHAVDLRKTKVWRFYEDPEAFCLEFYDAIL